MNKKTAFAIAAHPDDIEFGMMGTLLLLKDAGYEIHYMTVSNGSLGTDHEDYQTIVSKRRQESIQSASLIGAVYHESICEDIEVMYNYATIAKLVPIVRQVCPEIILTQHPQDYMEDHINAGRLAVTAAFCRGMINLKCAPTSKTTFQDVAVYHAMPHCMTNQLRRPVDADFFVNIESKMDKKRECLACHKSQKEWLDMSQGMDAYLDDMTSRARAFGKVSGMFEFAEGWVQHNPVGFGPDDFNPLAVALKEYVKLCPMAIVK